MAIEPRGPALRGHMGGARGDFRPGETTAPYQDANGVRTATRAQQLPLPDTENCAGTGFLNGENRPGIAVRRLFAKGGNAAETDLPDRQSARKHILAFHRETGGNCFQSRL